MAQERFESKITKQETGCWLWNAARRASGYGVFSYNGKPVTASRVSYILYNGQDPGQLHVLHKCDNRLCVNPDHLFLGTNKDNVEDRKSKGRPAGRYSGLTREQFIEVQNLIEQNPNVSLREIARKSGFGRSTVQRIAKGTQTIKFKGNDSL